MYESLTGIKQVPLFCSYFIRLHQSSSILWGRNLRVFVYTPVTLHAGFLLAQVVIYELCVLNSIYVVCFIPHKIFHSYGKKLNFDKNNRFADHIYFPSLSYNDFYKASTFRWYTARLSTHIQDGVPHAKLLVWIIFYTFFAVSSLIKVISIWFMSTEVHSLLDEK